MRVIRGLSNIRPNDQGVVATLGNFDGVHLGHQALLQRLQEFAPGLRRCAVLFEPQPLEFLRPDFAPARLQGLDEKLRQLQSIGLEQVLVLRFNARLAHTPAQEFANHVLADGLKVKGLVVGDDWRFGYQRQGDFALLQVIADSRGFDLAKLSTIALGNDRVSSTRVREALARGDLAQANVCLGRPYTLRGRVIHGQKLGRKLGAPTANIALRRSLALKHGVYCVRLDGLPGVANLGVRPSVQDSVGEHLEIHLLDGEHQLYDQMVRVEFEAFLRPELKFSALDQLQAAIAKDVQQARQHFQRDSE